MYRSGQTGQTVNLMAYAFVGSNPTAPIRLEINKIRSIFSLFLGLVPSPLHCMELHRTCLKSTLR